MMRKETLWTEKYRPKRIDDCILPSRLKETFKKYVASKNVPNLLLYGGPGVGKTTVALAMLDEMGLDSIVINASLKGNIDTLRTEITQFASSVSMSGGRKYVILDEADYLNIQSTQPSLRNFMETYSGNCGFILTCNYPNRIMKELHSRLVSVGFDALTEEKPELMFAFSKRVRTILDEEKVTYDKEALNAVIFRYYPDWRKTINELQHYSSHGGAIDAGMLAKFSTDISDLVDIMRKKAHGEMVKWVAEHTDHDALMIMRSFYDQASSVIAPGSIPLLVVTISKYQERSMIVADQEINLAAFLTEVMADCDFK